MSRNAHPAHVGPPLQAAPVRLADRRGGRIRRRRHRRRPHRRVPAGAHRRADRGAVGEHGAPSRRRAGCWCAPAITISTPGIGKGEKTADWLAAVRSAALAVDGDTRRRSATRCSPFAHGGTGRMPAATSSGCWRRAAQQRSGRWVWVYHAPPQGLLSWTGKRHYGDAVLAELVARHSPTAVLCGHIHEAPFKKRRLLGRPHRRHVAVQCRPPDRRRPGANRDRFRAACGALDLARRHRRAGASVVRVRRCARTQA